MNWVEGLNSLFFMVLYRRDVLVQVSDKWLDQKVHYTLVIDATSVLLLVLRDQAFGRKTTHCQLC
jgi:hypothetical protein